MVSLIKKIIFFGIVCLIFYNLIKSNVELQKVANYTAQEIKKTFIPTPGSLEKNLNNSSEYTIEGSFIERTATNIALNLLKTEEGKELFERLIQPMNSPLVASGAGYKLNTRDIINAVFSIKRNKDTEQNESLKTAICGQELLVDYSLYSPEGKKVIDSGTKKITLGKNDIAPLADAIISNINLGEQKSGVVTHAHLHKFGYKIDEAKPYRLLVKAVDIHNPIDLSKIKIFDDHISYDTPIFCGLNKQVTFSLDITSLATGEVLFKEKKITMTLGDKKYPQILSYILENKNKIGTRTAIVHGSLLKGLCEQKCGSGYMMLDIYDLSLL